MTIWLGTHSLRVARYSEAIAHGLGLAADEVAHVREAGALHDLGKYLVPRAILLKPGPLTRAEMAIVRRHPAEGAALLDGVADPRVVDAVLCHHERSDGSGYPGGLTGDAIPLGARIVAVADSFDAMTTTRPYRAARTRAAALAELREQAGALFDAAVVAAFALGLDEVAVGIDGPAVRDLRQPVVEAPAVRPLVA